MLKKSCSVKKVDFRKVKLTFTLIIYLSPLLRHLPKYYFDIKIVPLAEYITMIRTQAQRDEEMHLD
jgi:hypothetical protein